MQPARIIDEREMPPRLDTAIRGLLVRCFPADAGFFARSRAWHGSAPAYTILIEEDENVIAHLGVVERRIEFGSEAVDVAGVQNLCVAPEYRGNGLCRGLLDLAMDEASRRASDIGLLFCVAGLVPLYASRGWRRLPEDSVIRVDTDGHEKPLAEGNLPMCYPLTARDLPHGTLRLNGNDW